MHTRRGTGLILAVIGLPIFIGAVDLTVISAVLPHVLFDLELPYQASLDEAAWLVTGYLLAYAVAMTFMGKLSDLLGRRTAFLLSLAIFALGSYLVAVADGWPTRAALRAYYLVGSGRPDPSSAALTTLIASRMIQAFGGGAMVPIGMALVGDLYPSGERARPLGMIVAVDTAGWVVGHLYGGVMVRYFGWRVIFLLNLPVCLLAFALVWRLLRREPASGRPGRLDWTGAALLAAGLTLFNLGIGSNAELNLGAPPQQGGQVDLPMLLVSLGVLGVFAWWQTRSRSPLVPLQLFRRRRFAMASAVNLLVGFCLFVGIAAVPLFINGIRAQTLEQGAWESGWMLSALTVPLALAAVPGGWLTARWGYRWPAVAGLLTAAAAFLVMSGWQVSIGYPEMALQLATAGVGLGLIMAPIGAAALDTASEAERGVASGLVIIQRLIGMTIAISAVTSYGIRRANALSAALAAGAEPPPLLVEQTMQILAQVVNEIFLIAAIVCAMAIIPSWMLNAGGQTRRTA